MSIHATAIALAGQAVLLLGPSGSGKSRLALRLMSSGAWLVADDQTTLTARDSQIFATCPPTIRGRLEVRSLGIVAAAHQTEAPVVLALNLDPAMRPQKYGDRMAEFSRWGPPPGLENTRPIPCVLFDASRPDAAEAVIAALAQSRNWEDSPAL